MKKLFAFFLATTALTSSIGAQTDAKIVEVNANQIKIQYENGTEQTFVAAPAAPAAPATTTSATPAAKVDKSTPPMGFQFNVDLEGNLAFISGSRINYGDIQAIDRDFAVGGLDLTLGAGVRVAQWLYAGVASGILGEWGNPKVRYKNEEGKATYSAYTVPIYADVRTYAPTHGDCYPYAEVGIGGYVGIDGMVKFGGEKIDNLCGKPDGGFYFVSGVGLEFNRLNIGAGYKLMRNNNFTGNHGYVKIGLSLGRPQKLRH